MKCWCVVVLLCCLVSELYVMVVVKLLRNMNILVVLYSVNVCSVMCDSMFVLM